MFQLYGNKPLIYSVNEMNGVCNGTLVVNELVQKQRPEVLCKKGVLKNFANFTEKHLCWSPFFKLKVNESRYKQCGVTRHYKII